MFQRLAVCVKSTAVGVAPTPSILQKSRMRRRARTDLCGGRSVMTVPTATITTIQIAVQNDRVKGRYSCGLPLLFTHH